MDIKKIQDFLCGFEGILMYYENLIDLKGRRGLCKD